MTTQELTVALSEAVIKFHKADEMEKKAKELRTESRAIILEGLDDGLITAGDLVAGDKKVTVMVPMSKGKPSKFDQTRATEFREFCEDAYSLLLPAFTEEVTHTVNIEVLFALVKAVPTGKDALLAKIEECIIPAVEGAPMEPRVKAS